MFLITLLVYYTKFFCYSTCAVLLYQALQNSYPNLFFKWSYLFVLAIVRIQAILVSELLGKRDLKFCFDQVRIR